MPSIAVAPALFAFTGGDVTTQPARETVGAMVLRFIGGSVSAGPQSEFSDSAAVPDLERLKRQTSYFNGDGAPTMQMQLHWQRSMEAIEKAFAAQQGQITDLSVIVARLEAAEAQASAAQAQATETAQSEALAKSYIDPQGVISATSAGMITIAAHNRIYGDGSSVAINGGSLSGWTPGQFVQVYYDDAGRTGGAVAYQGTTDVIAQQGARHIVGGVEIPQAGEAPSGGAVPYPPGYIDPARAEFYKSLNPNI